MRPSRILAASLALSLGLSCTLPAQARMDGKTPAADDPNMTMYLGNIEVRGQKNITRTLQAIKAALTLPYSNDPKLANVMVCRFIDQAGSHVKQELICGTNRVLAQQRSALHAAMTVATAQNSGPGASGCLSSSCYEAVFAALDQVIEQSSGRYIHTTVDGAAMRSLLQQIPMPSYQVLVPVTPTETPAPAAASNPHTI